MLGSVLVTTVLAGALAGSAHADVQVAGTYEAKFEQIGTNCEHSVAFASQGVVKIEIKNGDLQVDIERAPLMTGKPRKDGKINAKSRLGHTSVIGMDGVFTVAGRIKDDGMVSLTLIGEYQAGGKPLCTQSWSLSGLKAKAEPKR